MLVEFVGCSGAGKTTQLQRVSHALLAQGKVAATSTAIIAAKTRTAWIRSSLTRNCCLNVLLIPWVILAAMRHPRFCMMAVVQIIRNTDCFIGAVQRLCSQLRNLAGYELLRRISAEILILVDQGTISGADNVLVHLTGPPAKDLLRAYAGLVPKPDLVVHINPTLELALQRTRARPDPPLRFHTAPDRARFVRLSHAVLIRLGETAELGPIWRTTSSQKRFDEEQDDTTDQIVRAILAKETEFNES